MQRRSFSSSLLHEYQGMACQNEEMMFCMTFHDFERSVDQVHLALCEATFLTVGGRNINQ